MTGDGAALQRIPVVRARVTVTELVTGASMTVTGAARLDWCAAVTTANSSELTTMRRTTAVRDQGLEELVEDIHPSQTGVPGQTGGAWLLELSRGNRSADYSSAVSLTAAWAPGTLSRDIPTLSVEDINVLKIRDHTISHITTIIIHLVSKCIFFQ